MMNRYELADALARIKQGRADEKDHAMVAAWLAMDKKNEEIYASILNDEGEAMEKLKRVDSRSALLRLHRRAAEDRRRVWMKAAAIAATLLIAVFFFMPRKDETQEKMPLAELSPETKDIQPANDKAVLVLASGKKIELAEGRDTMMRYGNIDFTENSGSLKYAQSRGLTPVEQQELITPNGGKYHIILADGTGVWLNAGSRLKFPSRFEGGVRRVELRGEGYFEVSKDKDKPFIVKTSENSQVQVLGTVFNIKGYNEGRITTTLLEGSVKVSKGESSTIIRPGEMAQASGKGIKTGKGDIDAATAWRQDKFMFHQMPIGEVMEELGRWYDISIVYEDGYRQQGENYNGEIGRNVTLDKLIDMLEQTGVARFKLKERTLYIQPY